MAEASIATVSITVAENAESEPSLPSLSVPSLALPGAKSLGNISPQKSSVETKAQALDDGPVPLSFPAILRNPNLANRYAYLHERPAIAHPKTSLSKARRDEHEGKRWIRRRENGELNRSCTGRLQTFIRSIRS
jgi:hypothetical protein